MSIGTALLLSLLAGFAYFSRRFLGDWYFERPIIVAPITGLILGDLRTLLIVGGTLELLFMGAVDIGGAVPPNYTIGGILGAAFAITSGQDAQAALVIAIPAALLGSFFEMFAKTICVFFVNAAERMAEQINTRGMAWMLHLGNITHALAYAIPTFIALAVGVDVVQTLSENMPGWLENGLSVAGGILPALGFALLLSTLATPLMFPFFFIGFLLAAYTDMGVLGVALLAFLVAIVMKTQGRGDDELGLEPDDLDGGTVSGNLFNPRDIRRIFFRSFAIQSAFSFDRMQAMGFTWALTPYLKKVYKDNPEGLKEALKRHLVFFNTFPWIPGPIMAITADMEGRKARGEDIDEQAIQGLKSGMMGPLAGIGDSMFHGTLRPVVGGIAAALALQGNALAPIIFFVTVNVVHVYIRWISVKKGFELGERALGLLSSGAFRRVMEGAAIAGLMAVGALVGTWLNVTTPLTYQAQEATVSVQEMLDQIMPKLLPLALTMLIFWLIRRGMKTTPVMLWMILGGLVLGALGILG